RSGFKAGPEGALNVVWSPDRVATDSGRSINHTNPSGQPTCNGLIGLTLGAGQLAIMLANQPWTANSRSSTPALRIAIASATWMIGSVSNTSPGMACAVG